VAFYYRTGFLREVLGAVFRIVFLFLSLTVCSIIYAQENQEFSHRVGGRIISTELIAWVDTEKVFEQYPGTKLARRELSKYIKQARDKLEGKRKRIKELEEENCSDTKGIFNAYFEYEKLQQETRESILWQEKKMRKEIMGRIYDAIERIGQQKGYTIILDRSMVLYSQGLGEDLTDEVLKELK